MKNPILTIAIAILTISCGFAQSDCDADHEKALEALKRNLPRDANPVDVLVYYDKNLPELMAKYAECMKLNAQNEAPPVKEKMSYKNSKKKGPKLKPTTRVDRNPDDIEARATASPQSSNGEPRMNERQNAIQKKKKAKHDYLEASCRLALKEKITVLQKQMKSNPSKKDFYKMKMAKLVEECISSKLLDQQFVR